MRTDMCECECVYLCELFAIFSIHIYLYFFCYKPQGTLNVFIINMFS